MRATRKTKSNPKNFTQKSKNSIQKPSREKLRDGLTPTVKQKPSRARETPKPVAALIELLNLLPLDHRQCDQLPELKLFEKNSEISASTDEIIDAYIADWPERLKQFVTASEGIEFFLRGLPFHLNFHIGIGLDEDGSYYRYLKQKRFVFLIESYNLLKRLPSLKESGGFFLTPVIEVVSCDENNRLVFSKSEISNLLEGIEASRVRFCPACYQFFWANHGAKQACSDLCGHALRNRIYREKNKDQIKVRRALAVEKAETQLLASNTKPSLKKGKK